LNRGYFDLVLAGTTTIGTQAAVEFVCGENTLKVLLTRLSVSNASELKPFEAVIHVKVARGVPVESEIVALRNAAQR
jgi:precorrin-2 methylase